MGMIMKSFRVHNPQTGHEFGIYEGETADDALDAMANDAGYPDYATACEVAGAGAIADEIVT
jgi:hypothetical protein